MDLKEEQVLGSTVAQHWYYRSKSAALIQLVSPLQPQKILDVGAGSGFFSKYLLDHTPAITAWCIDPFYPKERDDIHADKPIQYRHDNKYGHDFPEGLVGAIHSSQHAGRRVTVKYFWLGLAYDARRQLKGNVSVAAGIIIAAVSLLARATHGIGLHDPHKAPANKHKRKRVDGLVDRK